MAPTQPETGVASAVDHLQQLGRHSAVYVLGNIAARGANYILIPVYANILQPSEYGLLGIIASVTNAATLVLMFGLYAAAARLYFDFGEGSERRELYGMLWMFLAVVPALVLVGFDRVGPHIFGGWVREMPYEPNIRLAVWSAYLFNFSLLPTTMLRNRGSSGRWLLLTIGASLLSLGSALVLVVKYRQGVTGVVVAGLFTNLIMAGVYSIVMVREVEFRWRPRKLVSAITYSLPFWPHAMAGWALNLSDRVLLERFVSLAQIGIYSLGAQVGQAISVLAEGVQQAWAPFFFRVETEKQSSTLSAQMATYFVLFMCAVCLAVALGIRTALRLVTPPAYWQSEGIVLLLTFGFLSLAPYYIWATAIMHSKRVIGFPAVTILGGTLNVGLNLLLMPIWGIWAAAISTVAGYFALAGLNFWLARRTYPIVHEYRRWLKAMCWTVAVGVALQWVRLDPWPLEIAIRGAGWLGWLGGLGLLGYWTEAERSMLRMAWRRVVSAN